MNATATIEEEAPCSRLQTRENTAWLATNKRRSERPESSSQRIRKGKVRRIRRQLAEGKYEVHGHLSAAVDALLESLINKPITRPKKH
jgi:anti-sigma28 factor (negative regulator of flagellin synthesis)